MAAARQNEMNDSATVLATTTFVAVDRLGLTNEWSPSAIQNLYSTPMEGRLSSRGRHQGVCSVFDHSRNSSSVVRSETTSGEREEWRSFFILRSATPMMSRCRFRKTDPGGQKQDTDEVDKSGSQDIDWNYRMKGQRQYQN